MLEAAGRSSRDLASWRLISLAKADGLQGPEPRGAQSLPEVAGLNQVWPSKVGVIRSRELLAATSDDLDGGLSGIAALAPSVLCLDLDADAVVHVSDVLSGPTKPALFTCLIIMSMPNLCDAHKRQSRQVTRRQTTLLRRGLPQSKLCNHCLLPLVPREARGLQVSAGVG